MVTMCSLFCFCCYVQVIYSRTAASDGQLMVAEDCAGLGTAKRVILDLMQEQYFQRVLRSSLRVVGAYACEYEDDLRAILQESFQVTDKDCCQPRSAVLDLMASTDWDVLVAGWPCQPWSAAGLKLGVADARHRPLRHLLDMIVVRLPKLIVLENVSGISKNKRVMKTITVRLEDAGYQITFRELNSLDFVPQHRLRFYLVGFLLHPSKFDLENEAFWQDNGATGEHANIHEYLEPSRDWQSLEEVSARKRNQVFQRNLNFAKEKVMRETRVLREAYAVVDVGASPGRTACCIGYSCCITASRAEQQRLWICKCRFGDIVTLRKLSSVELAKLQGWRKVHIDEFTRKLSRKSFSHAIGNGMTCDVLRCIFRRALPIILANR